MTSNITRIIDAKIVAGVNKTDPISISANVVAENVLMGARLTFVARANVQAPDYIFDLVLLPVTQGSTTRVLNPPQLSGSTTIPRLSNRAALLGNQVYKVQLVSQSNSIELIVTEPPAKTVAAQNAIKASKIGL
jgi:hypothetical protein